MFLDSRNLPSDAPIETDVCIVGGGAAGISLATELVGSHLSVLLLESGGMEAEAYGRSAYAISPGRRLGLGVDPQLPWYFGGNTNRWAGNCRPLDEADFDQREWIPYSGWPIGYGELLPYYERAQAKAGLIGLDWYDTERCRPRLEHPPLEVDSSVLATRMVQTCSVPSFAMQHGDQLAQAENVRVVLNARAAWLEMDTGGARVRAVESIEPSGRTVRVEPGVVILAAGGVENARLLLASRGETGNGVANEHDLVGRFFMDHWFVEIPLGGWNPKLDLELYDFDSGDPQQVDGTRIWAQLALSEDLVRERHVPRLSMWFRRLPRSSPSIVALRRTASSALGRVPVEAATDLQLVMTDPWEAARYVARRPIERHRVPRQGHVVRVQIEQTPDPDDRITLSSVRGELLRHEPDLSEPELSLRLRKSELDLHMESLRTAADEVGLPARRVVRQARLLFEAGRVGFFWHHMGTTRMHADPAQGVVDADCRVHGVSNLFVAGSSVFPTSGIAAPTLTIVALVLRLADHIQQKGTHALRSRAPLPQSTSSR